MGGGGGRNICPGEAKGGDILFEVGVAGVVGWGVSG